MSFFKKNKKINNVPRRRSNNRSETISGAAVGRSGNNFGRNRTITGTKSDYVRATGTKPNLDSNRSHAHTLAKKRQKVLYVLGISLVVVAVMYWALVQFTASVGITNSDASIANKVKSDKYIKVIDEYLGLHPLQRFRFALNKDDLVSYIDTTLPEVGNISRASNGGIGVTNFSLTFRKGIASWTLGDKKYYVDSKGIAFENNYYGTSTVEIVDQSGISVQNGVTIASNRFLGFVGKTVSMAALRGYIVIQAIIPADTTRQLQIRIKDVVPIIKLSIDRPVGEQIEDMDRSIKYLVSRGSSPSYVDVRVSGKAFYR